MQCKRAKQIQAVSAGGIVYSNVNGILHVAICGRFDPKTYNLPKGTPEANETVCQTAIREVVEETGLEVRIERFVGVVKYQFIDKYLEDDRVIDKEVVYFLMRPVGGNFSYHDDEFDIVEWCPESELEFKLTYANEVNIVQKGLSLVKR